MEIQKLKAKYAAQKSNAKKRGIEWHLTFDQWIEWWGDDINKRGQGHDQLQMQRYGDKGPYAIGNIKKGYPRDNVATWLRVRETAKTNRKQREHQEFLDSLVFEDSKPDHDQEFDRYQEIREAMNNGYRGNHRV